jgi:hypothetical protein
MVVDAGGPLRLLLKQVVSTQGVCDDNHGFQQQQQKQEFNHVSLQFYYYKSAGDELGCY